MCRVEGASLDSANKTRSHSVFAMLLSICRDSSALRFLAHDRHFHPCGAPGCTEVVEIRRKDKFHTEVEVLAKVLEPAAKVIMAVQGAHTTGLHPLLDLQVTGASLRHRVFDLHCVNR
jgi:hypothetical protein